MAITPALFKIRFPEFDSVDDARIQIYIDDSVLIVNENYWGVKYNLGLYYLTAHYLALAISNEAIVSSGPAPPGLTGPVSSRSVGDSSISYSNNPADGDASKYLSQTSYGAHFLYLMQTLRIAAYVV